MYWYQNRSKKNKNVIGLIRDELGGKKLQNLLDWEQIIDRSE